MKKYIEVSNLRSKNFMRKEMNVYCNGEMSKNETGDFRQDMIPAAFLDAVLDALPGEDVIPIAFIKESGIDKIAAGFPGAFDYAVRAWHSANQSEEG